MSTSFIIAVGHLSRAVLYPTPEDVDLMPSPRRGTVTRQEYPEVTRNWEVIRMNRTKRSARNHLQHAKQFANHAAGAQRAFGIQASACNACSCSPPLLASLVLLSLLLPGQHVDMQA